MNRSIRLALTFVAAAVVSYFIEACTPQVSTTPAPAATSSGGSAVELARENERLRASTQTMFDLLRRRNAGENVDTAVAALEQTLAATPTVTNAVRTQVPRHRVPMVELASETEAPVAVRAHAPDPMQAPPLFPSPFGAASSGPMFRAAPANVVGNVCFIGPTPWQADGAPIDPRSVIVIGLVNLPTAARISVNGRRVCVSEDGGYTFPRGVIDGAPNQCVVPPHGRTVEVRCLATNAALPQQVTVEQFSYNPYTGVGSRVGSTGHTYDLMSEGMWLMTQYDR